MRIVCQGGDQKTLGLEPVTKTYSRPPIMEAVIGINFSSPVTKEAIDKFEKKFRTHYPTHQRVSNYNIALTLSSQVSTNLNKQDGCRLSTEDMTQMAVLWPSSFTVSQLAPYEGWDKFYERFVRDWALLKKVIGFQKITRVGVRYINRIDIPTDKPIIEYDKYIKIYPHMPNILQPTSSYALQAAVQLNDIDCLLKINFAVVPSPLLEHASFVIDQDISKEVDPPQNDHDIYSLLGKIRAKKNVIFEACVSDLARELFNERT